MHAIFHHPLPLDSTRSVASALRPLRMLRAFREAGYTIDVVAGHAAERRAASEAVIHKLSQGRRYEFMYSESSTLPTLLTEPNRIPTSPSIDFGLMRACRRAGVPVGLFYRDMYWMFPQFKQKYGPLARRLIEQFYRYDLRRYASDVDRLYVPSVEMGQAVPIVAKGKITALPPGHDASVVGRVGASARALRLLYVGGTGPHYEMGELFRAIEGLHEVSLTICTREADWQALVEAGAPPLPPNAMVSHVNGAGLDELYAQSDVALIFVAPEGYWSFAAPYKLYEYLGKGRPIIASEGTLAARFIDANGIGWSVPYNAESLRCLLGKLAHDSEQVTMKSVAVAAVAPAHTWDARAATVIDDMAELATAVAARSCG